MFITGASSLVPEVSFVAVLWRQHVLATHLVEECWAAIQRSSMTGKNQTACVPLQWHKRLESMLCVRVGSLTPFPSLSSWWCLVTVPPSTPDTYPAKMIHAEYSYKDVRVPGSGQP